MQRVSLFALAAALLVAGSHAVLDTDRTLITSGSVCIDKFNQVIKKHYQADATCSALIKAALSTADLAKCPAGSRDRTSAVQKCMAKSPAAGSDWVAFVRTCEVMNVANRAGEAEAATARKPSCMPDFAGLSDFEAYVGQTAAAASGAQASGAAPWLLAAAAAAAAVAL